MTIEVKLLDIGKGDGYKINELFRATQTDLYTTILHTQT